jgi:Ca2+/Na+ antiporter
MLLVNFVYAFVGYLYLWIRYMDNNKVQEVKEEYYENSYATAGATLLLSVIGAIFFIVLLTFLIGAIYIVFTRPPAPY